MSPEGLKDIEHLPVHRQNPSSYCGPWHFAANLGEAYRSRRGDLNEDVAWNIQQGLALTGCQISAAFEARRALHQRTASFMARVDGVAMPVSQVPPFPATERWVTEIEGQPQATYLD